VIASVDVSSSRKHLNPAADAAPGVHPTRRQGGARRELSERVVFRAEARGGEPAREVDGWALNASRSGLRAILEEALPLGAEFEVAIGEPPARPGRVVWLQEEKDGAIVGVSFLDEAARGGSIPDFAGTPMPSSASSAPPPARGGSQPTVPAVQPPAGASRDPDDGGGGVGDPGEGGVGGGSRSVP
jgi:hypothetical protein